MIYDGQYSWQSVHSSPSLRLQRIRLDGEDAVGDVQKALDRSFEKLSPTRFRPSAS